MQLEDFDPDLIQYVKSHYDEPHRVYHNWAHIESCFDKLPLFAEEYISGQNHQMIALLRNVAVGLLYHDIVYVPGAGNNEVESGYRLLGDWDENVVSLRGLVNGRVDIEPIVFAIWQTKYHKPTLYGKPALYSNLMSQILCDIDLADMGYTDGRYIENSFKVKEEFKATDEQWLVGRVKFLEDFMGRKRIFQTPLGVELWEKNTRNNMLLEYNALKMKYGEV